MVYITQIDGRGTSQVDESDRDRATNAADAVLAQHSVSDKDAYAAYVAQWAEFDDEAPMHGLALIWIEAVSAANIGLTEGWHNTNDTFCCIAA